jgi:hypothetical protein
MANAWINALKQYNANKDKWCLPKKGSSDYNKVRAIMEGKKVEPETKEIAIQADVKRARGRPAKIKPVEEKKPRGRPKKTI